MRQSRPRPSSRVSRTWEEVPTLSSQVYLYSRFLTDKGCAPARAAVDCPITTSGAAPLIVDGFRRVRRRTFTEGAIMERAEYNRHSRARMAETAKTRRDMQRRTRRSASTIGGAAPDTIIGHAAADRAGARPYRATRCENASKCATPDRAGARPGARPCQSQRHRLIKSANPRLLRRDAWAFQRSSILSKTVGEPCVPARGWQRLDPSLTFVS